MYTTSLEAEEERQDEEEDDDDDGKVTCEAMRL